MLMNCAWEAYLKLLPGRLRKQVDTLARDILQDTRLRLGRKPLLVTSRGIIEIDDRITSQDLQYCVNVASEYSPWSSKTISEGFITAQGGHRVGICGEAVVSDGKMTGIRSVQSVAIRVSRDIRGIANGLESVKGSVLILGSPGSGKTTLLRDLVRRKSDAGTGVISVVDEREEVFPIVRDAAIFSTGKNTDVLSGCPKGQGIISVLRNMGPSVIAVDEITHPEDCKALLEAAWCGVDLIATAHAAGKEDLHSRPVYKPLVESGIFQTLLILRQDKSWYLERISI